MSASTNPAWASSSFTYYGSQSTSQHHRHLKGPCKGHSLTAASIRASLSKLTLEGRRRQLSQAQGPGRESQYPGATSSWNFSMACISCRARRCSKICVRNMASSWYLAWSEGWRGTGKDPRKLPQKDWEYIPYITEL